MKATKKTARRMPKRNLLAELKEGVTALAENRQGKRTGIDDGPDLPRNIHEKVAKMLAGPALRGKSKRPVTIGIASDAYIRQRIMDIASGKRKPLPGEPKLWFSQNHLLARQILAEIALMKRRR